VRIGWKPRRTAAVTVVVLAAILLLSGLAALGGSAQATTVSFYRPELLGKPTNDSITVNVVVPTSTTVQYYYRYRPDGGTYGGAGSGQSGTVTVTAGTSVVPSEVTITGLSADTKYYYQMIYDGDGSVSDGDSETGTEHSFHTARAAGDTFTFSVTSDGHAADTSAAFGRILTELPDFNVDLGDTFIVDSATSQSAVNTAYLAVRASNRMGGAGVSVPMFSTPGNHEQEEGWNLDEANGIGSIQARKAFIPTPSPLDAPFYSANSDPLSAIDEATYGNEYREDYFAWTWGDALFIVIDTFEYTSQNPYGNIANEGGNDPQTGDQWNWTLGQTQYNWLKSTLEGSTAKYKFVFSHQMVGGMLQSTPGLPSPDVNAGYVRGGAQGAPYFEWGGWGSADQNDYQFATKRPGMSKTIRQLFIDNGVSAYFHGHDHQYVYETRDGMSYVEVPSCGSIVFSGMYAVGAHTDVAGTFNTLVRSSSAGSHIRITIAPTQATVDLISSGGSVSDTHTIAPHVTGPTKTLTLAVSPSGAGTTTPAVGAHSYSEGTVVDISAIPAAGYAFSGWTGGSVADPDSASTTVTMDADKTVTANFDAAPTVTINQAAGQSDPTNGSTVHFTVTFSEAVTDFATGDVTLSGSAGATAAVVSGSGATYDVAVSGMTGSGAVVASLLAGVAHDGAGNGNAASTSTDNSVTFDNVVPTVTINQAVGQADPTNTSPIQFTVVFSEAVTGFTAADVTLTGPGSPAATISGTGPTYTVNVTGMTGSGAVTATIAASKATDAAGNPNAASTSTDNQVAFDNVAPTVTINQSAGQADPTNGSPIQFTVVFGEVVTGFTAADVTLTGPGSPTASVSGSGPTYTVNVTGMSGSGAVTATIAASKATDAAGNNNAASTSTDNSVTYDNVAPAVTINQSAGQADPANASPINFTVVFSETVNDFATGDVTLSGTAGATTATVTGSGTTYNVGVSGMTSSGTVIATVAGSKAMDAAGNPNAASTSTDNSVTYDTVAPTVTINQAVGQDDPTNTGPIQFTVVFSEAVTGFVAGDVTLSGPGSPSASISGSGPTYTVNVTGMSGSGVVTATIAAGSVADAAGNNNTSSTSTDNSVTYDTVAPTVTINQASGQADPTNASPIQFTVAFSETVTGFATGDVSLSGMAGATTATVTGTGATYNVAVTGMTSYGTVICSLAAGVAHDAAGNANAASTSSDNSVTYDNSAPTVTINQAAGQADPTNGSPIRFTVVFSEAVTGFSAADVDLTGPGSPTTSVSGSGANYAVNVTGMSVSGSVTASIPAGVAVDGSGNPNAASTSTDNSVTFDNVAPTVTINQADAQADPTSSSPINFTVVFSEAVTGFSAADVALTGPGSPAATISGSGPTYAVSVTGMSGSGALTATIAAGSVADAAGNNNTSSTSTDNTVTFDSVAPTVTINQAAGQADPTNASPIQFTVVFSETVNGFATGDVSLSGTAGATTGTVTGTGATYNVAVSGMTGSGTVIATVAASKATDMAGNNNAASTSTDNSVAFDNVAPTVTINQASGQADPTNGSPIQFTVVFSEAVTGFTAADVTLTGPGSPAASISGSDPTYTVNVTGMSGSGTVTASIPAGVAVDGSSNPNAASTSTDNSVTFDTVAPTVTINQAAGQADPTNGSPIQFTVVFSEAVTGFVAGDVTLSGTAGATTATVTGSGATYAVAVSGMTSSGTVIATVAASKAADAAGNANAASTSTDNQVTYNTPYTLTLKVGWNLVAAAPGTATFPDVLFGWTGSGYQSTTEPVAWQGYWCKVASGQAVEILTLPGPHIIDLADGWNLIGNCMATPATLTLPSADMVAFVYDPDTGYLSTKTLAPGQGAWVKSTATGQHVTLTSSGS
jgi:uncharacterized repeat protein (TIGR02543 family)